MAVDENPAMTESAGQSNPPASDLKIIGKYQIEKKIGSGGMGIVYLAQDTQLKRSVALKVMSPDKAKNPILVKRFRAEAQAAAQLRHENIVAVYDSGEFDGYLFIAMEYVDGDDLFEIGRRRGVTPVKRSVEIIKQIASGLQHAFERGIVHRDIKPSNLLIRRDGVVKLADLGLARSIDDTIETNITRAGTTVGTVDYMSPEQGRNSKSADVRSDIYSLGCTWYHMLTGEPPYPEGSLTNKLQAHAFKPIPDAREKNSRVPEGLVAVLQRMMAKSPEDRYQSPLELLNDLDQAVLNSEAVVREILGDLADDDRNAFPPKHKTRDGRDSVLQGDRVIPNADSKNVSAGRKIRDRKPLSDGDADLAEASSSPSPVRGSPRHSQSRAIPAPKVIQRESSSDNSPHEGPPRKNVDDLQFRQAVSKSTLPSEEVRPTKGVASSVDKTVLPSKSSDRLPPKRPALDLATNEDQARARRRRLFYVGGISGTMIVIWGLAYLITSNSGVPTGTNPFELDHSKEAESQPTASRPSENPSIKQNITVPQVPEKLEPVRISAKQSDSESDVRFLPVWTTPNADRVTLPRWTVGPGPNTATHFDSLNNALRKVPDSGAVLQLVGRGPFPLTSFETTRIQRLVIMSTSDPLITIQPADSSSQAGIKLLEGKLEVDGIHFTLDRSRFPSGVTMLAVVDGQLFVRHSSFTVTGAAGGATVATEMGSSDDSRSAIRVPANVLLDRVFIRGDGLKGLAIHRANADVVIKDSLMLTGSAAAVELSGTVERRLANSFGPRPRRIVRVVGSTFSVQQCAFELSSQSDSGTQPPRTEIVVIDSLCCAEGASSNSSLLLAAHWPIVKSTKESWLSELKWSSQGSLYLGFEHLVDFGANETFQVNDGANWQRVWNTVYDTKQFQKITFPPSSPKSLNEAWPQEYDNKSLTYLDIRSGSGDLPGCPIEKLPAPPDGASQRRGAGVAFRPQMPPSFYKPNEPTAIKKVDLAKQDLGAIINSNDWPSGTLIEAVGSGLRSMTPAKINSKDLRIIFQQAPGVPLKLQPKSADSKGANVSSLFLVSEGSLELTNASIEASSVARPGNPSWLVESTNSTLVFNGCRLQGSDTDASQHRGLIRWMTTIPILNNLRTPTLICMDSYLASIGCGIRVEAEQGNLILKNSIIAIRGDGLDLRPVRSGAMIRPALLAEQVTFSCTGSAIRFQADVTSNDVVTSPMRLFVERCMVAPPLVFTPGEGGQSTFVKLVGPVLQQKQIEWCGISNGVATQVVHLLHRNGDPNVASEATGINDWNKTWKDAIEERMLTGDKGIYLNLTTLPDKWSKLQPVSFELHPKSAASTWAEGGLPIGADVRIVGAAVLAKRASMRPTVVPKEDLKTKPVLPKRGVGF